MQTRRDSGGRRASARLARGDSGVTAVEYVGVITVVAVLIAALALTPVGPVVSGGLRQAICSIMGAGFCGGTPGSDEAAGATGERGSGGRDFGDGGGAGRDFAPECSGFWCAVGGVARGVGSGVWNFGDAVVDDVTGLVDLVRDPSLLVDAGKAIWDDPLGVAGQLIWDQESRDLWAEGDVGGAIGRTVWNVGSIVVTVTKVGTAGKVGGLAGAVDDVADLAVDARRAADAAADAARAGDAATALERAAEARRIADEAAERARSLDCPLAVPRLVGHGGGGRGLIAASAVRVSGGARVSALKAAGPCDGPTDAARQADEAADQAEDAARALGVVQTLAPSQIRFSQSSVNGAAGIEASMRANGWVGDPIDVIKMPDGGLTSVDNTRLLAASRAGIDVQARVRAFDEAIPADQAVRFPAKDGTLPTTWGEAVQNRIASQNAGYRSTYPNGSPVTGWPGN